jgi:hypothetical protein
VCWVASKGVPFAPVPPWGRDDNWNTANEYQRSKIHKVHQLPRTRKSAVGDQLNFFPESRGNAREYVMYRTGARDIFSSRDDGACRSRIRLLRLYYSMPSSKSLDSQELP